MANNKQNPIAQFTALKEQLVNDLASIEIEMDNLERVFVEERANLEKTFDEKLTDLKSRRDDLHNALFGEVKAVTAEFNVDFDAPMNNMKKSDQVLAIVREYPGASRQDLRDLLPSFSEAELKRAISTCSKTGRIENRGTKARSEWHAV